MKKEIKYSHLKIKNDYIKYIYSRYMQINREQLYQWIYLSVKYGFMDISIHIDVGILNRNSSVLECT